MCFSHFGVFLISVKPLATENTENKTTPKICKITVLFFRTGYLPLLFQWCCGCVWTGQEPGSKDHRELMMSASAETDILILPNCCAIARSHLRCKAAFTINFCIAPRLRSREYRTIIRGCHRNRLGDSTAWPVAWVRKL